MTNKILENALYYAAEKGWYVFPCREKPGAPFVRDGKTITPTEKSPYVAQGLDSATKDADQIKAWWNKWNNALIGVNAGKSGLFVVDIDKKHVDGLEEFSKWAVNDSGGLHSLTPSGGMHIVFTGKGKSSTNPKTGIDTRGEGGYFIAPPSAIQQGEHPGEYRCFDDWARTPGVIPDGLMEKLFPDKSVQYVRGAVTLPEGTLRQLSRATLNFLVNGAPSGSRNASLFKVLADFAGCGYTQEQARETIMPICTKIGLSSSEVDVVLRNAYSKERTPAIPDSIQEKILAHKKDAAAHVTREEQVIIEDALLSCLLMDNTLIPLAQDILSFEDFSVLKNRVIFRVINRLYNSGVKADYITVGTEISKELNKATLNDISKLTDKFLIDAESFTSYAYIIREKAAIMKLEALLTNKAQYLKSGVLIESINQLEKDVSDIAIYAGAKSTSSLNAGQAVDFVMERTRQILSGEIEQLKTGFSTYDYHVGGLFSDELIICAARSGEGKSCLALSIINTISLTQNKACGLFSLEMSTHTNVCRLICQLTGIPYKYVYQGKLTKEQWEQVTEATQRIKESKIYFDEGTMSVTEIRAKLRKLAEKDIKLLVIDQLEQVHGYDGLAPHLQFDKITYDIKSFAKEFNIPIILNHQLNRNVANRKSDSPEPQLTDLNQAGEKAADQVWAIVHRKDEDGKILSSKISMLKNRNGPCVNVPIIFVADRMLFSNPMKQDNNDRGIPNSRSSNQAIPKDDADSFFDTNGE